MDEEKKYNGWTNYETWATALWLDNERGSYDYWREQAREHRKAAATCSQVCSGIWNAEQAAKFNLADQLKEEIRDNAPDTEASMYSDLLRGALDEVNWNEIAGNWLSDLEDIEDEQEPEQVEAEAKEQPEDVPDLPVIFSYTRAQALADGFLVDVTEGAKEAGIIYPTALTSAVWGRYVEVPDKLGCPDEKARVANLLFMFHAAAKASSPGRDTLLFDIITMFGNGLRTEKLKSICGPGDSAEPVITIMLPEED